MKKLRESKMSVGLITILAVAGNAHRWPGLRSLSKPLFSCFSVIHVGMLPIAVYRQLLIRSNKPVSRHHSWSSMPNAILSQYAMQTRQVR